jgi:Tol biopolymer transport system component
MTTREPVAMLSMLGFLLLAAGCGGPCDETTPFAELGGPYLGQTPPGEEAQLFAPGIISTGMHTRDVAVTPDGKELYFSVSLPNFEHSAILGTREVDGRWTRPEVVSFSGRYKDLEPALSPDGQRLYFMSHRPTEGDGPEREDTDIWVVDRTGEWWGEPYPLPAAINSDLSEYFPSVTSDGTIYFTRQGPGVQPRIYRARLVDGEYAEATLLPVQVNSGAMTFNAFVAPDESYVIVPVYGREDTIGSVDYYVTFRSEDDTWSEPVNLGERVNTEGGTEYSPYVTPDGKYFFFMATRGRFGDGIADPPLTYDRLLQVHAEPGNGNPGIWWIDAGFIEELRPG